MKQRQIRRSCCGGDIYWVLSDVATTLSRGTAIVYIVVREVSAFNLPPQSISAKDLPPPLSLSPYLSLSLFLGCLFECREAFEWFRSGHGGDPLTDRLFCVSCTRCTSAWGAIFLLPHRTVWQASLAAQLSSRDAGMASLTAEINLLKEQVGLSFAESEYRVFRAMLMFQPSLFIGSSCCALDRCRQAVLLPPPLLTLVPPLEISKLPSERPFFLSVALLHSVLDSSVFSSSYPLFLPYCILHISLLCFS